ncbi:MAG: aminoacetone oxidase family FAD-binding enzyme [Clostridiales bacterium]|nr:aminoacetone oxidase family FAD-binding enzyme [Clostridiales bacterium]
MEIIVIGGGAAGMAAAIEAARRGARVTLLERMERVGKKLLATGNGRCNLMNVGEPCYPGGDAFARAVLSRCGAAEQQLFWESLGLRLREEEGGRVYPASGQASTVLETLRLAMDNLGVQVVTGAAVKAVRRQKDGFAVISEGQTWRGDRVILAGGGCAQPKLGSDGSLWEIMKGLGHKLVKPRPALTQIMTDTLPVKGLGGIRVKAGVAVVNNGRILHEENGEVLFADYGVSGVCVMQCARFACEGSVIRLNLLRGMGFEDVRQAERELLRRRAEWKDQPMEKLLTGVCVPRLAASLCMEAGIRFRDRLVGSLKEHEAAALARVLEAFDLPVRGVKGFDSAQVTAGGLDLNEFDPKTLRSTVVPGLYAAGEMLDVDGTCGGFNLMFAFGSGVVAARACVEERE